jgi:predicted amidophosphoribosyltransferase
MLRHYFISIKRIVQELIHNLKYKGHEENRGYSWRMVCRRFKTIALLHTADEIIPVPLHPRKLKKEDTTK